MEVPELFALRKIDCATNLQQSSSLRINYFSQFAETEYATVRKIVFGGNVGVSAVAILASILSLYSLSQWIEPYNWEESPVPLGFLCTLWLAAPLQLFLSSFACAKIWKTPMDPKSVIFLYAHYLCYPVIVLVITLAAVAMVLDPDMGDEHLSFRFIVAFWFIPAVTMAFGSLFQLLFVHWEANETIPIFDLFATKADEFLLDNSIKQSQTHIRKALAILLAIGCVLPIPEIVFAIVDSDQEIELSGRLDIVFSGIAQSLYSIVGLLLTLYCTYRLSLILLIFGAVPVFVFNIVALVIGALQSEFGRTHPEIITILVIGPLFDVSLFVQWCMMIYLIVTMKSFPLEAQLLYSEALTDLLGDRYHSTDPTRIVSAYDEL